MYIIVQTGTKPTTYCLTNLWLEHLYMLSLYRIWVGVERRRNQTKRIFLYGIASSVNVKHIQSYFERRNINPTHISVFPSKRKA